MDDQPNKRRGPLLWLTDHSWRFWIVVIAVGAPVLYVASFGGVCWLAHRNSIPGWSARAVHILFWPLHSGVVYTPEPLPSMIRWYMNLFAP